MKITAKQYAQYLYNSIEGKDDNELNEAIKKFAIVLKDNNDLVKFNQISEQFIKIWNFEKKIVEAEIVSAKELDVNAKKVLIDYIKELGKANEIVVKEKINPNLLGGVIIRYGDRVLDGSLRNSLEELKDKLVR